MSEFIPSHEYFLMGDLPVAYASSPHPLYDFPSSAFWPVYEFPVSLFSWKLPAPFFTGHTVLRGSLTCPIFHNFLIYISISASLQMCLLSQMVPIFCVFFTILMSLSEAVEGIMPQQQ